MQLFIILSSCENYSNFKNSYSVGSSHQCAHKTFEVQHGYVTIKIQQVMSNQIYFVLHCMFAFQFSMSTIQIHLSHLYMSAHLWNTIMERMAKEFKSKMCNLSF